MSDLRTITIGAFQGDLMVRRITRLPDGARFVARNGPIIVAHSQIGHHHIIDDGGYARYYATVDAMVSVVEIDSMVTLVHRRDVGAHESLCLAAPTPGTLWEFRRQREMSPKGWRRVED